MAFYRSEFIKQIQQAYSAGYRQGLNEQAGQGPGGRPSLTTSSQGPYRSTFGGVGGKAGLQTSRGKDYDRGTAAADWGPNGNGYPNCPPTFNCNDGGAYWDAHGGQPHWWVPGYPGCVSAGTCNMAIYVMGYSCDAAGVCSYIFAYPGDPGVPDCGGPGMAKCGGEPGPGIRPY